MIELILGHSGSGKTTKQIDRANEEYKSRNGHIVFVDSNASQMFRLDHAVRLIDMKQYHIKSADRLFGFIAGILANDFDIERVFVDGLHQDMLAQDSLKGMLESLAKLSAENSADFILALNKSAEEIPEMDGVKIIESLGHEE